MVRERLTVNIELTVCRTSNVLTVTSAYHFYALRVFFLGPLIISTCNRVINQTPEPTGLVWTGVSRVNASTGFSLSHICTSMSRARSCPPRDQNPVGTERRAKHPGRHMTQMFGETTSGHRTAFFVRHKVCMFVNSNPVT